MNRELPDPPREPLSVEEFMRKRGLIAPDENLTPDDIRRRFKDIAGGTVTDQRRKEAP